MHYVRSQALIDRLMAAGIPLIGLAELDPESTLRTITGVSTVDGIQFVSYRRDEPDYGSDYFDCRAESFGTHCIIREVHIRLTTVKVGQSGLQVLIITRNDNDHQ